MIPAHFPRMVQAELKVIFGRGSGRLALGVALAVGILAVVIMQLVQEKGANAQANGVPISSLVQFSATDCAGWGLRARNFFVLPLVLLLASAGALGGEIADHTLRELLVRPVSRSSVVLAKLTALATLSACSLVLTLVPSFLGGAALFGIDAPPTQLLLGYLASWASDLGLIAIGLFCSTLVSNVGNVVVIVILLLMADLGARGVLAVLAMVGMKEAEGLGQILPGAALGAWEQWSKGWTWEPFLGLAVLLFGALAGTFIRVQRMDVQ